MKAAPVCSCCQSVGLKTHLINLVADGRIKSVRVVRRGRAVPRPAAWVTCHCGWAWWSTHPALVKLARQHPKRRLLRRHQKAPGHPGRGGKDRQADAWTT